MIIKFNDSTSTPTNLYVPFLTFYGLLFDENIDKDNENLVNQIEKNRT